MRYAVKTVPSVSTCTVPCATILPLQYILSSYWPWARSPSGICHRSLPSLPAKVSLFGLICGALPIFSQVPCCWTKSLILSLAHTRTQLSRNFLWWRRGAPRFSPSGRVPFKKPSLLLSECAFYSALIIFVYYWVYKSALVFLGNVWCWLRIHQLLLCYCFHPRQDDMVNVWFADPRWIPDVTIYNPEEHSFSPQLYLYMQTGCF